MTLDNLQRHAWTRVVALVLVAIWSLWAPHARAQQIGRSPVEVLLPQAPTPAAALGRLHLVYELHVTNFGAAAVSLDRLDVLEGSTTLASWSGPQLAQRVTVLGQPPAAPTTARMLPPGARAIAYLWLSLQPGQVAPRALAHRLTTSQGGVEPDTLLTAAVALGSVAATLASPVGDGTWVAVRAPSSTSPHRLALVTVDGRTRVPQRFAVDWARLGEDGLLFHGDGTIVTNWYGFDSPIHAAAAGVVALVRDGRADHLALSAPPPPVMEASEATGNVVVVDIGGGRFATYAHLKAGSLRVAAGDRVVAGQELARIGNSGNTLGPHLHFQISDAREPLAGEGLPFALERFELVGRIASVPALLAGTPWKANSAEPPRPVSNELPLENMLMRFGRPAGGANRP